MQRALIVLGGFLLPLSQQVVFLIAQPLQSLLNAATDLGRLQGDTDFLLTGVGVVL